MDTLQQIRDLFQDASLRERLDKTKSQDEALGIVVAAGAAKQVTFSPENVNKLIGVFSSPATKKPTGAELGQVSGQRMADTHSHMSCCTDCPVGNGLC